MNGKLLRKWLVILVFTAGVLAVSYAVSTQVRYLAVFADRTQLFLTGIADAVWRSGQRAEEIHRLRVNSAALTARLQLMEHVQRENKALRAVLGRESEELQFLFARVIAHAPLLADDFIVVDAGSVDNVSVGAVALVEGVIRFGTVVQVNSRSSTIRLLSHIDEKVPVYLPESDVSSVAFGRGAGALEIQVPASIEITEGEPIISVGPPDFIIGYVEKVEKSDAGPFQIVRTGHPFSIADVQRVFLTVIKQQGAWQ